jgi:hypothetical protein
MHNSHALCDPLDQNGFREIAWGTKELPVYSQAPRNSYND